MNRIKYTPEVISKKQNPLLPNEIFVFASNTEGIHGSGSARVAKEDFGAIYGMPMGLQNQSYAIITKDFKSFNPNNEDYYDSMLEFIRFQVICLYDFASFRKDLTFYVTKIGTAQAGFSIEDIASIFIELDDICPENIVLPKEFTHAIH